MSKMSGPSTRSGRLPTSQIDQQPRARWTSSLTKTLVDVLIDQMHQGNNQKLSAGNKWKFICDEFYIRTGLKWDREQLKYRCTVLKKFYGTVKLLLERSDFTLDEKTGAILADDEVWDRYTKEHPDADTLRISGCPIYKQLGILFSESGKNEFFNGYGGSTDPTSNVTEDCSTESDEVADVANDKDKSPSIEPPTTISRKRGRKGLDDMLTNAILEMASASKMRAEAIQQCNQRYSISKCVSALDELQDINENLYYAALDLFNDPIAREIFLSLKVDKRLTWLQGKCRFSSSSQVV